MRKNRHSLSTLVLVLAGFALLAPAPVFADSVGKVIAVVRQALFGGATVNGSGATDKQALVYTAATNSWGPGATIKANIQFATAGTSGSTTNTLGTAGPNATTTPNTWVAVTLSDGSTGYMPVWK